MGGKPKAEENFINVRVGEEVWKGELDNEVGMLERRGELELCKERVLKARRESGSNGGFFLEDILLNCSVLERLFEKKIK